MTALPSYLGGPLVLRFRGQRDNPTIRQIAEILVSHSYLGREPRGFHYAPSDFAKLWLDSAP